MAVEKPLPVYRFEDPNPQELWEIVLKSLLLAKLTALDEAAVPQ